MPYEVDNESLIDVFDRLNAPVEGVVKTRKTSGNKKGKKNSNAIKKMGRIILKKLKEYNFEGKINTGVEKMIELLE
jgi:hypothetical protein